MIQYKKNRIFYSNQIFLYLNLVYIFLICNSFCNWGEQIRCRKLWLIAVLNVLNISFTEGVSASHPKHCRWSLHLSAGQCTGSSCSARHTVELLCREFTAPDMWPLNSPDITTVDYCVWGVMQERVYHMPIEDIADLRQKVMSTWAGFQLSAVDEAIDQW